jgi:hypothetical protein
LKLHQSKGPHMGQDFWRKPARDTILSVPEQSVGMSKLTTPKKKPKGLESRRDSQSQQECLQQPDVETFFLACTVSGSHVRLVHVESGSIVLRASVVGITSWKCSQWTER